MFSDSFHNTCLSILTKSIFLLLLSIALSPVHLGLQIYTEPELSRLLSRGQSSPAVPEHCHHLTASGVYVRRPVQPQRAAAYIRKSATRNDIN